MFKQATQRESGAINSDARSRKTQNWRQLSYAEQQNRKLQGLTAVGQNNPSLELPQILRTF